MKRKPILFALIAAVVVGLVIAICCIPSGNKAAAGKKDIQSASINDDELKAKIASLSEEIKAEISRLKPQEAKLDQQIKQEMESQPLPRKLSRDTYQNCRLLKSILRSNKPLFLDYYTAFFVNKNHGNINADGLSVEEFVSQVRKKYKNSFDYDRARNNDPSSFSVHLDNDYESAFRYQFDKIKNQRLADLYKNVAVKQNQLKKLKGELQARLAAKALAARKKAWPQVKSRIEAIAPKMINENLGRSFDICVKVEVEKAPFHSVKDSEWWNGVAFLKNSRNGKTRRENIEVMCGIDGKTIVVSPKK